MRRLAPPRLAGLLPLLLLAACAGDGPASLPIASVAAGFPPLGLAGVIAIEATERLPLRSAELVAPDGTVIPSEAIEVTASPRIAAGPPTAATLAPLNSGEPNLPNPVAAPAWRSESRLLIDVSQTAIVLPDPVAYRRDWRRWRIRLRFGNPPGAVELREIAAPAPPPAAPPSTPPAEG